LKRYKSPGSDQIPAELIRAGSEILHSKIHKLIKSIWLGRPRRRWVDNIKMDLRGIEWDAVEWTDVAEDRDQWRAFVNSIMNLRVHKMGSS
jgi:hypothetical protein